MTVFFLALALAAAPATPAPRLTLPQQTALKCASAFAIGARAQRDGDPIASGWPPLAARGKEFFVRVMAQLMDDTGLDHDAVAALARDQARMLSDKRKLADIMPSCLTLLDASGL